MLQPLPRRTPEAGLCRRGALRVVAAIGLLAVLGCSDAQPPEDVRSHAPGVLEGDWIVSFGTKVDKLKPVKNLKDFAKRSKEMKGTVLLQLRTRSRRSGYLAVAAD